MLQTFKSITRTTLRYINKRFYGSDNLISRKATECDLN